ncbi:MAG: lysophospholipase [Candidatus Lernaella stagnicola]|nr:lysophospholipase [Candidatus Lernaella stagnicola]
MTANAPIEKALTAADRTEVFLRHWPVENPRGVVVFAHGLGSHGGRSKNIVANCLPAGYAIFAHDHRGHGKTVGRRGHVDRFDQFLDDQYMVIGEAREAYPDKKIFLMGHSLGGLIVLAYALRHADTIDGVIASSPALKLALEVPALKATVGRLLSSLLPTLALGNGIDPGTLSHDPEVIREYENDPLVHDRVSSRFFVEFSAAMDRTLLAAGALQMPLLSWHGGEDALTSPAGTQLFFERAGSKDKTFRLFEGQFHEVHNDLAKEELFAMLIAWLDSHV